MSEKTKPVKGYQGYSVSESGKIFRDGNEIKPQRDGDSYLYVKASVDGKIRTLYIHKALGEAFLDKPKGWNSTWIVNHKDGDKGNLSLSNLEWKNLSGNQVHAFDNKLELPPNGEVNGKSKISDKKADEVRRRVKAGEQKNKIAKSVGLSPAMVTRMTTKGTEKSPARRQRDGSDKLHREDLSQKLDGIFFGD